MRNFARKFTTKMNKTAQHIIDIKNVSKRFGEKTALNNINLYVRKGEFMTILGPSGCGKTTLLRLLAGFETASEGIITIAGNDITNLPPYKRNVNANKKRCDFFLSLHRNSSASGSGFEAWIAKEPKDGEEATAQKLVDALSGISGLPNRGVKRGYRNSSGNNYYVNSNTNMPSILLEVGFVTNDEDNKSFDKNLDDYAEAIAEIIFKYIQNKSPTE